MKRKEEATWIRNLIQIDLKDKELLVQTLRPRSRCTQIQLDLEALLSAPSALSDYLSEVVVMVTTQVSARAGDVGRKSTQKLEEVPCEKTDANRHVLRRSLS